MVVGSRNAMTAPLPFVGPRRYCDAKCVVTVRLVPSRDGRSQRGTVGVRRCGTALSTQQVVSGERADVPSKKSEAPALRTSSGGRKAGA